jgi:hypothetical protein
MSSDNNAQSTGSIMSQPATDLAPPKDDPFTAEQLKQFDGATPDTPIYVAIKGPLRYGLFIYSNVPSCIRYRCCF